MPDAGGHEVPGSSATSSDSDDDSAEASSSHVASTSPSRRTSRTSRTSKASSASRRTSESRKSRSSSHKQSESSRSSSKRISTKSSGKSSGTAPSHISWTSSTSSATSGVEDGDDDDAEEQEESESEDEDDGEGSEEEVDENASETPTDATHQQSIYSSSVYSADSEVIRSVPSVYIVPPSEHEQALDQEQDVLRSRSSEQEAAHSHDDTDEIEDDDDEEVVEHTLSPRQLSAIPEEDETESVLGEPNASQEASAAEDTSSSPLGSTAAAPRDAAPQEHDVERAQAAQQDGMTLAGGLEVLGAGEEVVVSPDGHVCAQDQGSRENTTDVESHAAVPRDDEDETVTVVQEAGADSGGAVAEHSDDGETVTVVQEAGADSGGAVAEHSDDGETAAEAAKVEQERSAAAAAAAAAAAPPQSEEATPCVPGALAAERDEAAAAATEADETESDSALANSGPPEDEEDKEAAEDACDDDLHGTHSEEAHDLDHAEHSSAASAEVVAHASAPDQAVDGGPPADAPVAASGEKAVAAAPPAASDSRQSQPVPAAGAVSSEPGASVLLPAEEPSSKDVAEGSKDTTGAAAEASLPPPTAAATTTTAALADIPLAAVAVTAQAPVADVKGGKKLLPRSNSRTSTMSAWSLLSGASSGDSSLAGAEAGAGLAGLLSSSEASEEDTEAGVASASASMVGPPSRKSGSSSRQFIRDHVKSPIWTRLEKVQRRVRKKRRPSRGGGGSEDEDEERGGDTAAEQPQKWIESTGAELFFGAAIVAHAALLGITVHVGTVGNDGMPIVFFGVDLILNLVFLVEFLLKSKAWRSSYYCAFAGGFDGTFVLIGWLDIMLVLATGLGQKAAASTPKALAAMRVLRLLRVLRLKRLAELCPELAVLVSGLRSTFFATFWSLALLALLSYVGALFCTTLLAPHKEDEEIQHLYGSVPNSLLSHVVLLLGEAWPSYVDPLTPYSGLWALYGVAFIVICNITILNVITGVICEHVLDISSHASPPAQEDVENDWQGYERRLRILFQSADGDGSGYLDVREYLQLLRTPECKELLGDMSVGLPLDLRELFAGMRQRQEEPGRLIFSELWGGLQRLRGTLDSGSQAASKAFQHDLQRCWEGKVAGLDSAIEQTRGAMSQATQASLRRLLRRLKHTEDAALQLRVSIMATKEAIRIAAQRSGRRSKLTGGLACRWHVSASALCLPGAPQDDAIVFPETSEACDELAAAVFQLQRRLGSAEAVAQQADGPRAPGGKSLLLPRSGATLAHPQWLEESEEPALTFSLQLLGGATTPSSPGLCEKPSLEQQRDLCAELTRSLACDRVDVAAAVSPRLMLELHAVGFAGEAQLLQAIEKIQSKSALRCPHRLTSLPRQFSKLHRPSPLLQQRRRQLEQEGTSTAAKADYGQPLLELRDVKVEAKPEAAPSSAAAGAEPTEPSETGAEEAGSGRQGCSSRVLRWHPGNELKPATLTGRLPTFSAMCSNAKEIAERLLQGGRPPEPLHIQPALARPGAEQAEPPSTPASAARVGAERPTPPCELSPFTAAPAFAAHGLSPGTREGRPVASSASLSPGHSAKRTSQLSLPLRSKSLTPRSKSPSLPIRLRQEALAAAAAAAAVSGAPFGDSLSAGASTLRSALSTPKSLPSATRRLFGATPSTAGSTSSPPAQEPSIARDDAHDVVAAARKRRVLEALPRRQPAPTEQLPEPAIDRSLKSGGRCFMRMPSGGTRGPARHPSLTASSPVPEAFRSRLKLGKLAPSDLDRMSTLGRHQPRRVLARSPAVFREAAKAAEKATTL
eukprot:TRINITY_DN7596_c0_g1_i2.p1 TRINITY_DN7596_c0_g1~~TRINITY_DN7596_c0_g1_i2.p1  ORF type:complete len:1786 (-),score=404.20 TRINITY_DN7596_c0_g1_i2:153-5510(-)